MSASPAYQRERRARLRKSGLCIRCQAPRAGSRSGNWCDACADKHRDYERRRRG